MDRTIATLRPSARTEPTQPELDRYDWPLHARPEQLPPPGDWTVWLLLAGRGFGKTRTGAEYVRAEVQAGRAGRIALVAPTAADARDVMVEGPAGIMAVSPPWFEPVYEPSKRRLTWPNGAVATTFSADEPRRLRGPEHDLAWPDELAAWAYPEAWDMLMMGLRRGARPRAVVTTTPRPIPVIRELLGDPGTVVTRGSTYDNRANLAPAFLEQILRKYEGTRLGRQELHAEILDDVPGALWTRGMIEVARFTGPVPPLTRVVVAIDPAVTSGEDSDETGIIATGIDADGTVYVLADRSCRATPDAWARRAVNLFDELEADRIVAEVNNGGDLVEATIRTVRARVPYRKVTATRGKRIRAEPVAAMYEQGRVKHVVDPLDPTSLNVLEDQLVSYAPDQRGSPDRMDALVWGVTDLVGGLRGARVLTL
jgi:phage terminase large subunit-like protein